MVVFVYFHTRDASNRTESASMTEPCMTALNITLDRTASIPLKEQLCSVLKAAMLSGQLAPGARLPSWQDLAAQLGIARGTVRAAYDRLMDEQLIESAGAAGTFVAYSLPRTRHDEGSSSTPAIEPPMQRFFPTFSQLPMPFQLGVPAHDAFPAKVWARLATRSARWHASQPTSYSDPRGEPALRREIASYLATARGIRASADQIIVTQGYRAALHLVIHSLNLAGREAWLEDPGFGIARIALELAHVRPVAVPVDQQGLMVQRGMALAADAALAVVTPSQQAPLGMTLSRQRRAELLAWAQSTNAWIVEDDYLGELQLEGRAAPALAAQDEHGRVFHIGTFSKSISPHLGLGFVLVPAELAERVGQTAAYLSPAPGTLIQHLVTTFMAEGHFLRHLRKMKRLYRARRDAVMTTLVDLNPAPIGCLAVMIPLPANVSDVSLCQQARELGISPTPLSPWFDQPDTPSHDRISKGLILCVTNCPGDRLEQSVKTLRTVLAKHI